MTVGCRSFICVNSSLVSAGRRLNEQRLKLVKRLDCQLEYDRKRRTSVPITSWTSADVDADFDVKVAWHGYVPAIDHVLADACCRSQTPHSTRVRCTPVPVLAHSGVEIRLVMSWEVPS